MRHPFRLEPFNKHGLVLSVSFDSIRNYHLTCSLLSRSNLLLLATRSKGRRGSGSSYSFRCMCIRLGTSLWLCLCPLLLKVTCLSFPPLFPVVQGQGVKFLPSLCQERVVWSSFSRSASSAYFSVFVEGLAFPSKSAPNPFIQGLMPVSKERKSI